MAKREKAECDCCGYFRPLSRTWAYGIETFACDQCRGWPADEQDEDDVQAWGSIGPDLYDCNAVNRITKAQG